MYNKVFGKIKELIVKTLTWQQAHGQDGMGEIRSAVVVGKNEILGCQN